ncbi:hypothetical protein GVAMD_0015 [Gardnerella vaginalis AMD]|nr:hypothetical protein GVAMD_0015 [Gardnerella vaginalis AMD]
MRLVLSINLIKNKISAFATIFFAFYSLLSYAENSTSKL